MRAGPISDGRQGEAQDSEWRRGWPVLVAATVGFGASFALFMMSAGLFIAPMRAEHHWSMSQVAFAPVVGLIVSLMMPPWGVIIDWAGPRRVAIFGILLFAAAYVALATLPLNLPVLYAIVGAVGLLGPAGNAGAYTRVVASWFRRNPGLAFGITLSGTSVGGVLVVPLAAHVIERYGWRAGYLSLAAIIVVVALPLVIWLLRENPAAIRRKGAPATSVDGQTLGETLKDGRFYMLMLSLGLAALPMGAYLVHLQPLLRSQHFSLSEAAGYGGLFALAIGVGRVGGGFLVDKLWDFGVATGLIALAALGCFTVTSFGPEDPRWAITAAVVAIGLSYGAEVDFGAYFALKLFGLRSYSKIFGFKSLVVGGGVALGGMTVSALFDLTGSYKLLGPVTGALFLLAALTMLLIGLLHERGRAAARAL